MLVSLIFLIYFKCHAFLFPYRSEDSYPHCSKFLLSKSSPDDLVKVFFSGMDMTSKGNLNSREPSGEDDVKPHNEEVSFFDRNCLSRFECSLNVLRWRSCAVVSKNSNRLDQLLNFLRLSSLLFCKWSFSLLLKCLCFFVKVSSSELDSEFQISSLNVCLSLYLYQ